MSQSTSPPPPPSSATGPGRAAGGEADPRSSVEVVRDLVTQLQTLLRQEVELARLEAIELITARAKALAAVAVAGVVGLFALGFLASAGAHALDLVVPAWASRLIVAAVFVAIAAAALVIARAQSRIQAPPLERTKTTSKENVEWARHQLRR